MGIFLLFVGSLADTYGKHERFLKAQLVENAKNIISTCSKTNVCIYESKPKFNSKLSSQKPETFCKFCYAISAQRKIIEKLINGRKFIATFINVRP